MMRAIPPRALLALGSLAVLLPGAGCGGTPEGRMDVYPVRGSVTIDGRPAAGADIVLHPTAPLADKNADYPRSGIAEDGSFAISTYGEGDGAPAGTYRVSIFKGGGSESEGVQAKKAQGGDPLRGFKDPATSGLTLEVKPSTNAIPPFELRSTRPGGGDPAR